MAIVPGGIVAILLQVLGLSLAAATGAGVFLTCIAFILLARQIPISRLSETRSPDDREMSREVRIGHVVNVIPVDDLEDFGPGYLLETSEGERVFLSGQIVADHDDEGEALYETVTLCVSTRGDLLDMECSGSRVPVCVTQTVAVQSLGVDPAIGFCILGGPCVDRDQV